MDNNNLIRKKLLAAIRKADYDFGLIEEGDRILVGLSGGKDSLALVDLLSTYRKFPGKNFELAAIHLDFGFPFVDFTPVERFVRDLGIPYIAEDAKEVAAILDQHRNPATGLLPCSICSRMRKAIINKAARSHGFHKVAFAHHMDDAIETLFLNMAYGGRVATFEPKMHLEKADIQFIRPLIYAREKQIQRYSRMCALPVCKNSCGNDKRTQREYMKAMLANLYRDIPDAENNFAAMLTNQESFQLFFDRYGAYPGRDIWVRRCFSFQDMQGIAQIARDVRAEDDFSTEGSLYYILYKDRRPSAYLKAVEKECFDVDILCFEKRESLSDQDASVLLDVFAKNLSMRHCPRTLSYRGTRNRATFLSFGYEERDGVLEKKVEKALKI